jgi:GNAT superfamily N-acetyltransferase
MPSPRMNVKQRERVDVEPDPSIDVHPATAERWPDVANLMGGLGSFQCWCQYWRMSSSEYSASGRESDLRRARLHDQTRLEPAPGVLAYVDGRPVGWCGFGPRSRLERLVRSRTILPLDDKPVWSIVCFLVRPGFRRRGVAKALLGGVIDYARQQGAVGLEAYPVANDGRRVDTAFAYVGLMGLFEQAGFRRVHETAARSDRLPRWLVRLDL